MMKKLEDGPVWQATVKALREAEKGDDVAEVMADATTALALALAFFPERFRRATVRGMLDAAQALGGDDGSPDSVMLVAREWK